MKIRKTTVFMLILALVCTALAACGSRGELLVNTSSGSVKDSSAASAKADTGGNDSAASVSQNTASVSAPETTSAESGKTDDLIAASSGSGDSDTAPSETIDLTVVEEDGMKPIPGDLFVDGTYDVVMKSGSPAFAPDHAELVIEGGKMQAVLYMTGKPFLYLYPGTAEKAAAAPEADLIRPADPDAENSVFTLPVDLLNVGLPCAACSSQDEKWETFAILFRVDSLPIEAFEEPPVNTVSDLELEDGTYTAEVMLWSGTGEESLESPALITISGDKVTAVIVWDSDAYDYMMVGEEKFEPVNKEGNSAFEVPVIGFDWPLPMQVDTTASGEPALIDVKLLFVSESIEPAS